MNEKLNKIELRVIKAMHRKSVYGAHHKRVDTIIHSCSVKPNRIGEVKKAIYLLIKKGFIIWAKKSEKAIQLNKQKIKEINEIVKD